MQPPLHMRLSASRLLAICGLLAVPLGRDFGLQDTSGTALLPISVRIQFLLSVWRRLIGHALVSYHST